MDRLVCGDVGYGKTEVAIRAAFKAVTDDKQVAVLVPTTILAQQHYATFNERISNFPVKIEVLSRFRTEKEQKEVVKELKGILAKAIDELQRGKRPSYPFIIMMNPVGSSLISQNIQRSHPR
jgi:RecG-like helicase